MEIAVVDNDMQLLAGSYNIDGELEGSGGGTETGRAPEINMGFFYADIFAE